MRAPKLLKLIALSFLFVSPLNAHEEQGETFAVVVNADNSFASSRNEAIAIVRRLYLKHQRNWPNGSAAVVFARPSQFDEEAAFSAVILNMSESELASHWLNLKQTRGETPPRAVGSTRILLRQIERKPNAFGVIRKNEFNDQEGVKILFEFEGAHND